MGLTEAVPGRAEPRFENRPRLRAGPIREDTAVPPSTDAIENVSFAFLYPLKPVRSSERERTPPIHKDPINLVAIQDPSSSPPASGVEEFAHISGALLEYFSRVTPITTKVA